MKLDRVVSRMHSKIGQSRLPTILTILLIFIFFNLALYIAVNLKRSIIPDEAVHIAVSEYFSTNLGIPSDSPASYPLGVISHRPFLYYWINGRLLNIFGWVFSPLSNWKILLLLRLTNVLYATLAVVFFYLLAKEVIKNPWWHLLCVFLLTNTLMFVFLAGGVNYDNLANLCGFAAIYFLIRLLRGQSFLANSLAWLNWILIGSLVKITILPLLAVTAVIWGVYFLRYRPEVDLKVVKRPLSIGLLVVFFVVALLNFSLYGMNLIQYHSVEPGCLKLLTESQCEQNAVFLRDKNAAEGASLRDMLNGNAQNPAAWSGQYWFPSMLKMAYGVMGGAIYTPTDLSIALYYLWFVWMVLLYIYFFKKMPLALHGLAVTIILYTIVLLTTNLSSELRSNFKHLGIQGRYIFPVIGTVYGVSVYSVSSIPNKLISGMTVLFTLALFFLNGPVWTLAYPSETQFYASLSVPEEHTISLGGGNEVSQDIRSDCSGDFTRIEVLFSKSTPSTDPLDMRLVDGESQELITQQRVKALPITDQGWLPLSFPPISHSKYRQYRLTLSASGNEHILDLWNTTSNVYRGGDAIVRGVPTNQDLIFRYTCKMPPLTDWFNESVRP